MKDFIMVCAVLMIFVNGATDTPGSVAGAVTSGALTYKRASSLCAVGNVIGCIISCVFFPQVAKNIASIAGITDEGIAFSLVSAVLFSSVAWIFGIPTSESHGLIASLGGASLRIRGNVGVNFGRMVAFSFLSCAVGAFAGYTAMKLIRRNNSGIEDYSCGLALSAFGSSFCHGAQDGQKFAVILALASSDGRLTAGVTLLSAVVLGIGCFFGGRRMINKLGGELVGGFRPAEAFASDVAAFGCTFLSSVAGIPVSTTYMKTFAMVGAAKADKGRTDKKTLCELILTWSVTYPVCMGIAYVLCAVTSN